MVSSRRSLRAGEPGGATLRSRAAVRSVSPGGDGRGVTGPGVPRGAVELAGRAAQVLSGGATDGPARRAE
jgi:hypothetical protein